MGGLGRQEKVAMSSLWPHLEMGILSFSLVLHHGQLTQLSGMKWGAGRQGVGRAYGKTFPKVGRTGPQGRPRLIDEFWLPGQVSGPRATVPGFVIPSTWDRRGSSQKGRESVSLSSSLAPVGIPRGQVGGRARILCYGSAPKGPPRLVYPSLVPREAHLLSTW